MQRVRLSALKNQQVQMTLALNDMTRDLLVYYAQKSVEKTAG